MGCGLLFLITLGNTIITNSVLTRTNSKLASEHAAGKIDCLANFEVCCGVNVFFDPEDMECIDVKPVHQLTIENTEISYGMCLSRALTSRHFTLVLAWLNLDFGLEVCFSSQLDMFWKTLLQFLFPLYIWVLLIVIIVASRYSTTAAKLSGRNTVPILATLFPLS